MTNLTKPITKQIIKTRGESLENDLRALLYNERFFDIKLKCSNGIVLGACKNILSARSNVFNNFIQQKNMNNIEFDKIDSNAMEFILNFLYTCEIDLEKLTIDNIIEIYHATEYFELDILQKHIIEYTKQILEYENDDTGKKLLSNFVNKYWFNNDNEISQVLIDWLAKIPLVPDEAEKDSLSLMGLRYFLCKTYDTRKPFATFELDIFEYIIIKIVKIIVKSLEIKDKQNEKEIISKRINYYLKLLIPYIDLRRIESDYIIKKIEPMNVFPSEMITDAYRFKLQEQNKIFRSIRGIPIFRWNDNNLHDNLYISKDGFTLQADQNLDAYKHVIGDLIIRGKGIYEWDIIIEKLCKTIYIGICDHKEFNQEFCYNNQYYGWVLGSDGFVYNKKKWKKYTSEKFKEGDKVTVHLNMTDKTCAFSVNNFRNDDVTEWKNIPSEICPIVSLKQGSRLRIQPHFLL
ncbi:hypothetical protein RhiirA1_530258 [Rhizophagus irregularis]|uniref:BTB domain-containing protein n=3 Tax=Rhizophagus irregularis TaxID=588596 RepID=A0A2I1DV81_9GLOM|nr:hypothetical protein RhiirA1_530258 [Rhizophagus irregularis]PKY13786.1 hypothetical protein RhiirB3_425670 [Rhizophagus irregularis]CAB4460236.1 unnamed protein product [Rhizophagus irregularis]CAB5163148.1 unnamed protein product [Rhizophagus irregularis]CAB5393983.1 unnamed protein product [Rhizophagus irregularis]